MNEKRAVAKAMTARYRKASKKDKGRLLDEFVALTGYHRWYAVGLLRGHGQARHRGRQTKRVTHGGLALKVHRRRTYDESVAEELKNIWAIMDYICGKRLAAILPEVISVLECHHEIALSPAVREKLRSISAASIDRLLAPERSGLWRRGRSGTKPGTLLKHQIPIRTFAQWNDQRPGFVEIDLVGHDGGLAQRYFCQNLDVTDVMSGWTETRAVINKAQVWVFEALQTIRTQLPFPLLGIDSDNGSEFINNHLLRYCEQEQITFTRGRAWRKNDGCFVEQKNYSVVRRAVGYARYETPEQWRLLNELYSHLRLYTNFFQPVMKLLSKERSGAQVKKTYDRPQTPYQRLLSGPWLSTADQERLKAQYAELNPAYLKRAITGLQTRLLKTAARNRPSEASTMTSKLKAKPDYDAQLSQIIT